MDYIYRIFHFKGNIIFTFSFLFLLSEQHLAFATIQIRDTILCEGKEYVILEYPLEDLLWRDRKKRVNIDEESTANRKG